MNRTVMATAAATVMSAGLVLTGASAAGATEAAPALPANLPKTMSTINANPACASGSIYKIGWKADGDKLFVRDCKADGWGVKAGVYYYRASGGGSCHLGSYTGLSLTDPSAKGDGGWKGKPSIAENRNLVIVSFSYKGNKATNVACGLVKS